MPSKKDPYATLPSRIIDLILILFVILVVTFTIYTAPPSEAGEKASAERHRSIALTR